MEIKDVENFISLVKDNGLAELSFKSKDGSEIKVKMINSTQPVVTWKGKDKYGSDITRVGQINKQTGKPCNGGIFREEYSDFVIYEYLSLDGTTDNCLKRDTSYAWCYLAPRVNGRESG